jgi:hypothetical protein
MPEPAAPESTAPGPTCRICGYVPPVVSTCADPAQQRISQLEAFIRHLDAHLDQALGDGQSHA